MQSGQRDSVCDVEKTEHQAKVRNSSTGKSLGLTQWAVRDWTFVEVAGLWAGEAAPWIEGPQPIADLDGALARRPLLQPFSSSAARQAQAAFHCAQEPLD